MTKYWEDFYDEVLPYVENCPNIIAKRQIVNAAIEFCQRTALWRKELDPINVAANIDSYSLHDDLDSDEEISAIDYAYLTEDSGETPLNITTTESLQASNPTWRTLTGTKMHSVAMLDTENLRVYPIPDTAITNGLVVGLLMKPSRDSIGLPDWIYEQYVEAIAAGAKARLHGMKSRSWYDPAQAADEQDDFDNAVKDATVRTNKGNSRKGMRVRMRPLA